MPIGDADAHRRPLSEIEKGRVKQHHDDIAEVVREYKRKTANVEDFVFPTIITVQDTWETFKPTHGPKITLANGRGHLDLDQSSTLAIA